MSDIVLVAINAKFIHTAFGLRCLKAGLGPLRDRAEIVEFDIHQRPIDMAESILGRQPRIVGLGIYIWNATVAAELAAFQEEMAALALATLRGIR